jgi:hypothetical protein
MHEESLRKSPDGSPASSEIDPSTWVERHGEAFFSYAWMRVQDRGVAEDLVQEAFPGALRTMADSRGQFSERTWLIGILKHKIADRGRKLGRERPECRLGPEEVIQELFDDGGHWRRSPRPWGVDPAQLVDFSWIQCPLVPTTFQGRTLSSCIFALSWSNEKRSVLLFPTYLNTSRPCGSINTSAGKCTIWS